MAKKRGKSEEIRNRISISTLIILAIFLLLSLTFFYLLDYSLGAGFGIKETIFSISIAVLVTAFLIWMKSIVKKNTYLGISISLFVLLALVYSVLTQYRGQNTTIFLIAFSIFYLAYVIYIYFKFKNYDIKKFE